MRDGPHCVFHSSLGEAMYRDIPLLLLAAALLAACDGSDQSTDKQPSNERRIVTVDADQLSVAIVRGQDDNGKSKAAYFLEFERGDIVRATNSFVYGRDTSSSNTWTISIGDNAQRVVCRQTTKEAKMVAANLNKKLEDATVVGEFTLITGDIVYLENCIIEGGHTF